MSHATATQNILVFNEEAPRFIQYRPLETKKQPLQHPLPHRSSYSCSLAAVLGALGTSPQSDSGIYGNCISGHCSGLSLMGVVTTGAKAVTSMITNSRPNTNIVVSRYRFLQHSQGAQVLCRSLTFKRCSEPNRFAVVTFGAPRFKEYSCVLG